MTKEEFEKIRKVTEERPSTPNPLGLFTPASRTSFRATAPDTYNDNPKKLISQKISSNRNI